MGTKRRGVPKVRSQTLRGAQEPQTRRVLEVKTKNPKKFWMTILRLNLQLPQQKRKEVHRGRNLKIMNRMMKMKKMRKWRMKILKKFLIKRRYKPSFLNDKYYYLLPTYSTL